MSPITLDPLNFLLLLSIPRIPLHVRTNFRGSALLCIYGHEFLPNLFMAKKVSFDFTPKNCLTISVGTVAGRFNDRDSRSSPDPTAKKTQKVQEQFEQDSLVQYGNLTRSFAWKIPIGTAA